MKFRRQNNKKQKGIAVLEYCAAAAVILLMVWGSMQALGTNYADLIGAIGGWASQRATEIRG